MRPGALTLAALCRPQKIVETMIMDMGCAALPRMATRAVCGAWLGLRAEAAALQGLKRRVNELNRNRGAAAAAAATGTAAGAIAAVPAGDVVLDAAGSYTAVSGDADDVNRTKRIKIKV